MYEEKDGGKCNKKQDGELAENESQDQRRDETTHTHTDTSRSRLDGWMETGDCGGAKSMVFPFWGLAPLMESKGSGFIADRYR